MGKKLTYDYVKKYIENQGYKLLSKEYINTHNKLKIQCPHNHIFLMSFNNYKKGQRCPICARKNQQRIPKKPNNIKHSQEYIINLVESRGYKLLEPYKNKRTKLKLQCPNEHYHEIRLDSFKSGSGCKQCMIDKMTNKKDYVQQELLKKGYKLLSEYKNNKTLIILQCEQNHIFESTFDRIINHDCMCPYCYSSKGNKQIKFILDKHKVNYITEKRFKNCKFYRSLPFDFYLPDYNLLIEFDGVQHYKIIEYFGGYENFIDIKIRDTVKNIYCKNNNINLLRIPYWDYKNIEDILVNYFNQE